MDAPVTETSLSKPRRPWLAGTLSLLCGPVGQVYVGRLRRSLLLWCFGACLFLILGLGMVSLPVGGRFGTVFIFLCCVAVPIYSAIDAVLLARRDPHTTFKRYQRWWIYVLMGLVFCSGNAAVADLLRSFVGEAFMIPTGGMSPTIRPGDRILVDRRWYSRNHLHRNDVVVYRSEGPDSPLFVQRIAGLPGDEIEIKNERVFINGVEWDEPHAAYDGPLPDSFASDMVNHGPIMIPADCIYLVGDHRRTSKDSRLMGPIPISSVHGVARLIYWSRERIPCRPNDTVNFLPGAIHWDRIGLRLD